MRERFTYLFFTFMTVL